MIHRKNKKGVSDVITTVLIILLVLAAVAIIGGILLRNIGDAGSKIGTQTACLDLDVKPAKCTRANDLLNTPANVLVSRGGRGNDVVISDLTLLFEEATTKEVTTVVGSTGFSYGLDSLKALETDSYTINSLVAGKYNVRVAATITGIDGRKVVCDPSTVRVDCKP